MEIREEMIKGLKEKIGHFTQDWTLIKAEIEEIREKCMSMDK